MSAVCGSCLPGTHGWPMKTIPKFCLGDEGDAISEITFTVLVAWDLGGAVLNKKVIEALFGILIERILPSSLNVVFDGRKK